MLGDMDNKHAFQGASMTGGMRGGGRGACVAGEHAWHARLPPPVDNLQDTVNERTVRILLECILV